MPNPQFDVVLKGVLAGFNEEQAKADFISLFSLDTDRAARLFAAKKAVLKSGVSHEIAGKYVARLASIGIEAVAEEIVVERSFNSAGGDISPTTVAPNEVTPTTVAPNEVTPTTVAPNEVTPTDVNPTADVTPSDTASTDANPDENEFSTNKDSEPDLIATDLVNTDSPASGQGEAQGSFQQSVGSGVGQKYRYGFQFSGAGVEYFKIWIVNILLSIVTLGIYSAWAKVRNKQYFYGNTHIADATFEYTAEPIKILKGRIVAFVLYIALAFSGKISPVLSLVVTLAFLFFLPWIIVNSLKFNARHSSYRNIPFRFHGTIGGALKVFIGWPLLGILSLGLLFPFAWKKQTEYITNNHSYSAEPFHFDVHVKEYYKMLLILIGASVVFFIVFAMVIGGSAFAMAGGNFDPRALFGMIPMMLGYLAFYFALGAYVVVTMANIHWNNTKLKNHQFESDWSVFSYMGLIVTNTLGILFTLGLFIPFAKVRSAAYKANHTALLVEGDLDGFIADKLEESNSLAEGVHDIFDIDISI